MIRLKSKVDGEIHKPDRETILIREFRTKEYRQVRLNLSGAWRGNTSTYKGW